MSNLKEIIASCGDATIVAATKYVDTSVMEELLANGINNFGENRVDSFLEKYAKLASNNDIVWHFIGTLQTNKVKKMINKISYLHSLNSVKLASVIDKYRETPLNCFLEVNLTESLSKTGINPDNIIINNKNGSLSIPLKIFLIICYFPPLIYNLIPTLL